MMFTVRRSNERGFADHGWLRSYHTFSFAGYHDPRHMSFRTLRVMNEDWIAAGQGFGTHPHRDMEIVTYVLSGALEHQDSMGNGEVLRPGEFQRITAGTGITHSEFNPSSSDTTHLYQIWLLPERRNLEPGYEQKAFDPAGRKDQLQLVASRDGNSGSLRINQDAQIYLADLAGGKELTHELTTGRHAWIQVLRGSANFNGHLLAAGDALAVSDEQQILVQTNDAVELMLFDLA